MTDGTTATTSRARSRRGRARNWAVSGQVPKSRGPLQRVLFAAGIVAVAAGVAVIGFVPYALYATNSAALGAQRTLEHALSRTVTRTVTVPASARRLAGIPRVSWPATIALGTPIARITIAAAGVTNDVVVEGADELRLEEGPGHYPGTALPGEPGNLAIAGHRTTWLHPFYNLQAVHPGDRIIVTAAGARWIYTTQWVRAVSPSDVAVIAPTTGWDLTLTTCNPRYSATQRLILRARLDRVATLAIPVGAHKRLVQQSVVIRVASHPTPLPPVPIAVLVGWSIGVTMLVIAAFLLLRRSRLSILLFLPAAACCFEAYGAAARLLPATW